MWKAVETKKMLEIGAFHSAFEASYTKNYIFSGETHNFWEMVYVAEGNLCVSSDDRIYSVTKNELVFHKPMELHKFNIESPGGAKLFIVSFDLSGELSHSFKNKVFKLNTEQKSILDNIVIHFRENTDIALDRYSTHQMQMYSYLNALTIPVKGQLIKSLLEVFLLTVCDGKSVSITIDTAPDAAVFSSAVRYMSANADCRLMLPDIARECGVSLTYLKNTFTKYAGMGIHKYFLSIKIQQATQLLAEGCSVTYTADKLNFSSQNYFSIVFRRETGLSPTEYIKSLH